MMNAVAKHNKFKSFRIPHLKTRLNAEHDTFKKSTRQAVLDHYEEANENCFCQFAHDGATLLNKDKHQAFVMQFSDNKLLHNNAITLLFRKPVSHESNKVAELAEESCHECFELDFQHAISSPT